MTHGSVPKGRQWSVLEGIPMAATTDGVWYARWTPRAATEHQTGRRGTDRDDFADDVAADAVPLLLWQALPPALNGVVKDGQGIHFCRGIAGRLQHGVHPGPRLWLLLQRQQDGASNLALPTTASDGTRVSGPSTAARQGLGCAKRVSNIPQGALGCKTRSLHGPTARRPGPARSPTTSPWRSSKLVKSDTRGTSGVRRSSSR